MQSQRTYIDRNHAGNLLSTLSQMMFDQVLCSASIHSAKSVTKAHCIILCAMCPKMRNIVKYNNCELVVRLPVPVRQSSVRSALKFLYQGKITISDDSIDELEEIGKMMGIDAILKCCSIFRMQCCDKTNITLKSEGDQDGEEEGIRTDISCSTIKEVESTCYHTWNQSSACYDSRMKRKYVDCDHAKTLLSSLSQMMLDEVLCSASVFSTTSVTKAHCLILTAMCFKLKEMFKYKGCCQLEVKLPISLSQLSVKTFLHFLYQGQITVTDNNVEELEKIGHLLGVDSVLKCCTAFRIHYFVNTNITLVSENDDEMIIDDCSSHSEYEEKEAIRKYYASQVHDNMKIQTCTPTIVKKSNKLYSCNTEHTRKLECPPSPSNLELGTVAQSCNTEVTSTRSITLAVREVNKSKDIPTKSKTYGNKMKIKNGYNPCAIDQIDVNEFSYPLTILTLEEVPRVTRCHILQNRPEWNKKGKDVSCIIVKCSIGGEIIPGLSFPVKVFSEESFFGSFKHLEEKKNGVKSMYMLSNYSATKKHSNVQVDSISGAKIKQSDIESSNLEKPAGSFAFPVNSVKTSDHIPTTNNLRTLYPTIKEVIIDKSPTLHNGLGVSCLTDNFINQGVVTIDPKEAAVTTLYNQTEFYFQSMMNIVESDLECTTSTFRSVHHQK